MQLVDGGVREHTEHALDACLGEFGSGHHVGDDEVERRQAVPPTVLAGVAEFERVRVQASRGENGPGPAKDLGRTGSYGDQRIVSTIADTIDVSPVFLSSQLGHNEVSILRDARVRYLIVDLRLAQSLPLLGYYYEQSEADAYKHTIPVSLQALTKFNAIPQINRVFDSGNIVIYNVGGLTNAP